MDKIDCLIPMGEDVKLSTVIGNHKLDDIIVGDIVPYRLWFTSQGGVGMATLYENDYNIDGGMLLSTNKIIELFSINKKVDILDCETILRPEICIFIDLEKDLAKVIPIEECTNITNVCIKFNMKN